MRHPSVLLSLAFGLTLHQAPAALLRGAAPVIDLTHASVVIPPGLGGPEQKAVQMLIEEVEKRSRVRWELRNDWPKRKEPVVLVGQAAGVLSLAAQHGIVLPKELGEGGREGFRLGCMREKDAPIVWVAGNDARGVLFGVGRLLRELRMAAIKSAIVRRPIRMTDGPSLCGNSISATWRFSAATLSS